MLVERFKWLVLAQQVPVWRILAITFTEKAAANMRRRLVEVFPASSTERKAVERAYISTIHGFCARLLRENAIEAAVDPEFRVLDEWEAGFELQRAIEEALEQQYGAQPDATRHFLARFGSNDVHGSLFALYEAIRAAGVSISEVTKAPDSAGARGRWQALLEAYRRLESFSTADWSLEQRHALNAILAVRTRMEELLEQEISPQHFRALEAVDFNLKDLKRKSPQTELLKSIRDSLVPDCRAALLLEQNASNRQWFFEVLEKADAAYRERKRAAGALDFSDLEEDAVRLLKAAGGRLRGAFSYILMDEFQDTNPLQAKLVELLRSRHNLFAVGDINQSIYGFRHADLMVFLELRQRTKSEGGHVVELFENFRSRPEVLKAVKQIIAGADGIEPQDLTAVSEFPPVAEPCVEILAIHAPEAEDPLQLEAQHVASRIEQVAGARGGWAGIAVLLRTSNQVRVFERALRDRGIPCEVTEGRGYYDAREVNDLFCFLRVLLNPLDEISLAAVLRSPLVGVSDDSLLRLKLSGGTLAAGLESATEDKLQRFRSLLDRYRREHDYEAVDRLLARLLAETGYEAWLHEQPGGAHMAANVRKLLALARRFQAGSRSGLREFVDRLAHLRREQVREAEARPPEQSSNAVQLMTVHAAKGLEFPVVFLGAINRRTRFDSDAVSFSPGIGVGMRWRDPQTGDDEPDAVARAISEEAKANRRDETQRLFYVAMTRAIERLVLSASFGSQVKVEQWAANLKRNLKIDFKQGDGVSRELVIGDSRYQFIQITGSEIPPAARLPLVTNAPPPQVWIEQPTAGEQSDPAASATSVALFGQCPRRYYLSRYLGFDRQARERSAGDGEAPELDEMDSTEFGRHVHGLLAGAIPRERGGAEALRLVANFEGSDWGRRAAAAARVGREQPFLLDLGSRLVSGQIDLWFRDGEETVIIDYKTDEVTAVEAPGRAAEYDLQLRLYALALAEHAAGRRLRALLYFLRPNLPVEISLDPAALEAARGKVEELFQAQSRLEFPVRPGPHCFRCPHFRGICPASPQ